MEQLLYRLRNADGNARGTVLLYHGFGAQGDDLFSLADTLDPEHTWNILCPQAPVPLQFGSETFGYAWFPDQPDELQAALSGTYFADLPALDPPGLSRGARGAIGLLSELDLDVTRLVAGGFSQGAMMAVETALQTRVDALLLFSGALIAENRLRSSSKELEGVPVFQCHGTADQILSFQQGQSLSRSLEEAGARIDFRAFDGPHTIPVGAVAEARSFLYSADSDSSAEPGL